MVPTSGKQYEIKFDGYSAVIASVGASLRVLRHDGRDLVVPFDSAELRPAYRGCTLAPWPNRVVDGRYVFDGTQFQLPLTEPARAHALHGLAAWISYDATGWADDRVTLAAWIEPQNGYPWRIGIETTYVLNVNGLTQTVVATNQSESRAPFGTGPHPYLVAGPGVVDDWTFSLPASSVLNVTPDRLAPVALASVESDPSRFDFRQPRRIAAVELDHAFTDLHRESSGDTEVRLTTPSGAGVLMSWNRDCPWVQVHTADQPDADPSTHRIGLAVEPMTCAPGAFNGIPGVDTGLLVLQPGSTATASWRIAAIS